MKNSIIILLILFSHSVIAQLSQEEVQHYIDSLSQLPTTLLGHSIPAFSNKADNGQFYSDESLKNKITFINFYYKGCPPCISEIEALNKLYSDFKTNPDFQFLSFTMDKPGQVKEFSKKYNVEYPIISVSHDSCYYLNLQSGFPTNIVSDINGKIAYYRCGGSLNPEKQKDSVRMNIYPVLERLLKTTR